jgi:hypothetical protein
LIISEKSAECVNDPLSPVTVTMNVPTGATGFALIFSVDVLELLTGFGVKLAVTFDGRPETLSVTLLAPLMAPSVTVSDAFDLRATVSGDGTEIVKSLLAAGVTATSTVVVCVPLEPTP